MPKAASNGTPAGEGPDFADYRAGRRMDYNEMAAKGRKKPSTASRDLSALGHNSGDVFYGSGSQGAGGLRFEFCNQLP
jgi:hypothetical protein